MTSPSPLPVLRWLIRDTFLQSRASGLFWLLLGINALVILVCLSAGVEGENVLPDMKDREILPRNDMVPEPAPAQFPTTPSARPQQRMIPNAPPPNSGVDQPGGELTLAFGTLRFPLERDLATSVRFVQVLLVWIVADTLGILLALVWTAGFMPRFLSRHTAPLVLAKPISPTTYVLGKFLGGVAFVAFYATVFFVGTWFALGVRTDVWDVGFFLCLPVMLFHFAVFYAFSIFLAVVFRSTVACVFGTIAFWFLCWGMNYGHHMLLALPAGTAASPILLTLSEGCYWFLPKPADLGMLLFESLGAASYFSKVPEFQVVEARGAFHPMLSLFSSGLFAATTLLLSAHELRKREY